MSVAIQTIGDVAHYNDVARLAIVGKDPSQHWMAAVNYYSIADIDVARAWVSQLPDPATRRRA